MRVEYHFCAISFGEVIGCRGNLVFRGNMLHILNISTCIHWAYTLQYASVYFIDTFSIVYMCKSVGKQGLLSNWYTKKFFSCQLKSILRYQFYFYNKWEELRGSASSCLVLNEMEANYQTRTRMSPFIHSTWVHLQRPV